MMATLITMRAVDIRTLRTSGLLLLSCAVAFATGSSPASQIPNAESDDIFCGPRCAQFVLEYYGHTETLVALAREMQTDDTHTGASLRDIANALERRGVHCKALRLGQDVTVHSRYDHPLILHLRGKGRAGNHFCVLTHTTDSIAQIWMGLEGMIAIPAEQVMRLGTGVVLLTSPHNISNVGDIIAVARHRPYTAPANVAVAIIFVLSVVLACRRMRRPAHVHVQRV